MSLNMKTLTQAFAKASAVIEKTVQTTVQEVTGLPKAMQDYNLLDQIASAGPGLVWKLYNAKVRDGLVSTAQYPSVCVWVLDKRAISEARQKAGISKASEDAFLDIIRADAARLVRLRHPGVVHVVQALDESKNAMAMVTEPLFASIANALGNLDNIANPPKELKGMEMGLLEVKHGLLQIAETLDFLHNNARLIHRGISPETILITSSGAWKFGGFGFTISADQASTGSSNIQSFHYAEYDVEDSILPLQPSMNYTAPELVRSKTPTIGSFSDIFSFGCLAYHLIARKPLFDCHNNVKMYMNSLTYLSSAAFTSIPEELVPDLQRMLSSNESIRPSAMDFTGSPFFRNDTRLRALRFLDHLLERDNMQKSEFLKALSDMWKDFDARVLRYKVLPPLCAELRNLVMQPMILPMVLTIAESQDKFDFEVSTLPALVPVLSTAAGDTLLLLVKNAELIISKASKEHLITHVLPMLVRAYDDNDNRLQEEVLKRTGSLAKQLDVQLVSKAILPRVHGLALKTTVAAVRVNALLCLSEMVHMLDKPAVIEILQTIQRCTAVDRSPPTLMCTLGVANSISKQYGIEFVAEHVLPLVMPLLIAQQLNVQQFAKYMLFVKETLRKIEEKRGVTLSDSGNSELLKPSNTSSINGGLPGHHARSSSATLTTPKRSPSWDEDWVSNSRSSTSTVSSNKPTTTNQPQPILSHSTTTAPPPLAAAAQKQQISSVPAVDVEWPPRSTLDRLSDSEKMKEDKGDASFDEIDPFANWPPRTSTGSTTTSYNNNGGIKSTPQPTNNFGNFQTNNTNTNTNTNSWAFNTPSFADPPRNTQGNYNNNLNSVGGLKSEQAKDIGSIFSSYKSEQSGAAPRLAPPPTTSVGRGIGMGRGRGRGNQGQPIRNTQGGKSQNEQTSLLDLL